MTASPVDTTTDLHAVIAALRAERDVALSEKAALAEVLAKRNSEFGERIEHQTTTIEVLKTMSASPDDVQPVFNLIARQAATLCNVPTAAVATFDGKMLHLATQSGFDAAYADAYVSQFPRPVGRDFAMGRAILNRRVEQVEDITAYPGHSFIDVLGHWSVMAVPMLRHDVPLGAITIGRPAIGPFSASQVALLQTFAEQAVIAITSAETYRALQTRTSDLHETLEYQTATSDVLNVISRSTFDLQPVLETVVQTSARLCNADRAAIFRREGDLWRLAVNFGFPPAWEHYMRAQGAFSSDRFSEHAAVRAVVERRPVHIDDLAAVPGYGNRLGEQRTTLGVPLLREGEAVGTIVLARLRVEPFTDRQIELVNTFADQAVIAIENTRLITEQREALEQQTATAEVLQVINASPGDLRPVFETMLDRAMRLSEAAFGELYTFDGESFEPAAHQGVPVAFAEFRMRTPLTNAPGSITQRIREGASVVHVADVKDNELYRIGDPTRVSLVDIGGARTVLTVALRKDESLLGFIVIYRQEVKPFSDRQVALLQNFAAQAVIAMENARLLTEQQEELERQTAFADVLQTINASRGNLTPVFDAILGNAMRLCQTQVGTFWLIDNGTVRIGAARGWPPAAAERYARPVHASVDTIIGRIAFGGEAMQIADLKETDAYRAGDPMRRVTVDEVGIRTLYGVPLTKDGIALGALLVGRSEVRSLTDNEMAILRDFANQAVIAIDNARLLNQIRQRQEQLRVTFENMGDGVALFDETPALVAWNSKFQDILNLPDGVLAERLTFPEYIRYLTERGEFGVGADPEEQIRRLTENTDKYRSFERIRPGGRVIEVRHNPVPDGGFVLIYADITERKHAEAEIAAARDAAEAAARTIEAAYRDLKIAQANLIQAEKMASLGQLTAGIAHEIKNPLNFVNNFAALSVDLLSELKETAAPGFAALSEQQRAEIDDVSAMLTSNLEKITEHGKRADGIVKAMLEHSRGSSVERRMVDLNALVDEALNLAYHGARAQDQSFNITLERDFGEGIAPIEVNPQDMTRVFLNLFSNGFYAANKRARNSADAGFAPTLKVTTRDSGDAVEVRVRDNGTGIPDDIRDKLFQPFFTTKPTGEGTGLGLSITYDIVTKAHGGTITVDSKVGEYSEFTIRLPRNP